MTSFSKQVADFAEKYNKRMRVVPKEAVQEIVAEAQTPGPSVGPPSSAGNGGRMPVQSGFLRASIAAAIGRMPSGESALVGDSLPSGDSVAAALLRWNPSSGDPLYVGWTAAYARAMEYRYGFMRGATEQWPQIVDRVAKRVRSRI